MGRTVEKILISVSAMMLWSGVAATAAAQDVSVWLTTGDQQNLLSQQPGIYFDEPDPANVYIDPDQQYQEMVGFGASMTDAAAINIRERLSPAARDNLMYELFGPGPYQQNFSFMRLTVGGSDFSPTHYTYGDTPNNAPDPNFDFFSIDPIRASVLPLVQQARAINPDLKILATPFSAPAWMKTSGSLIGGSLRYEYYVPYANFLVRYLDAMQAEGVRIDYLTVQNEPLFEPGNYPGMSWPAQDRASFYANDIGPLLAARGNSPAILDFDHNWNLSASPIEVLNRADANPYVRGVAWHCYGGEPSAQSNVRDLFPDKDVFFTECSGGDFAPVWSDNFIYVMRNLIIGGTRNWSRGVLMWNLALDENYGPRLGGCTNCTGIVTINSQTGAIQRNSEYYAFGHASRFIRQGARRIESTYQVDGLETVAFRNPDGSYVLLVLNGNGDWRRMVAQTPRGHFSYWMPPRSSATFTWNQ